MTGMTEVVMAATLNVVLNLAGSAKKDLIRHLNLDLTIAHEYHAMHLTTALVWVYVPP